MTATPSHPYLESIALDPEQPPAGVIQVLVEANDLPLPPLAVERLQAALDRGIVLAVCCRDEPTLRRAAAAIALATGLIDCLPLALAQ